MLLLCETAQGYGLFKVRDKNVAALSANNIADLDNAKKLFKLKDFVAFENLKIATMEVSALQDGKLGNVLKDFLKKSVNEKELCVWDKKLASTIHTTLNLNVKYDSSAHELFRHMKSNINELVGNLDDGTKMNVSLAHSLSRYKLKYSPEKVDIMVIQAVGLLTDLDKELNNLSMRLREWYGFHFPELLKLVESNLAFAKFVLKTGLRENVKNIDNYDDCDIEQNIQDEIKILAESSMGNELVEEDLECIFEISDKIITLYKYRNNLNNYLRTRMEAIAPNLTHLVGDLIGAKLLAHGGSLVNLAKLPSSTIQILGAEKALFRALKTKSNTPKYGLIYHAKLVGQASNALKGKVSRLIANKIALCVRLDACGENVNKELGKTIKANCEKRLEELTEYAKKQQQTNYNKFSHVNKSKYIPVSKQRQRLDNRPTTL